MGLKDFLSLDGNLPVSFLFHEVTSLHPPSFQRNFFPLVIKWDDAPHILFTYLRFYGDSELPNKLNIMEETIVCSSSAIATINRKQALSGFVFELQFC